MFNPFKRKPQPLSDEVIQIIYGDDHRSDRQKLKDLRAEREARRAEAEDAFRKVEIHALKLIDS